MADSSPQTTLLALCADLETLLASGQRLELETTGDRLLQGIVIELDRCARSAPPATGLPHAAAIRRAASLAAAGVRFYDGCLRQTRAGGATYGRGGEALASCSGSGLLIEA